MITRRPRMTTRMEVIRLLKTSGWEPLAAADEADRAIGEVRRTGKPQALPIPSYTLTLDQEAPCHA